MEVQSILRQVEAIQFPGRGDHTGRNEVVVEQDLKGSRRLSCGLIPTRVGTIDRFAFAMWFIERTISEETNNIVPEEDTVGMGARQTG